MALFGKPKVRGVVTLAIESTDVRLLTTKGDRVVKWKSVALPPGLVIDGLITNAVEMGEILDELFSAEDVERKRVITSLTSLRATPRLLTMPTLQASMLEQAITREAKKEMPLSLDSLYLSWQSMPGKEGQQQVYLLGVPRELVDAQVRSLEAAGIPPYAMDLKPLALIRAVGEGEAILVDLEQDVLNIVLVIDFIPAIMRSFSLRDESPDMQHKLDRLLSELTQTIRFYNDSHRGRMLETATPIYITGRLLDNREASEYLRNVIDRTIQRPSPPLTCPEEMPTMEYMTNLGLALKRG